MVPCTCATVEEAEESPVVEHGWHDKRHLWSNGFGISMMGDLGFADHMVVQAGEAEMKGGADGQAQSGQVPLAGRYVRTAGLLRQ